VTPTVGSESEECKFRAISDLYKFATLSLERTAGDLSKMHVRVSSPDGTKIDISLFLVDPSGHLRMYAIHDALREGPGTEAACLEGTYPLYEHPSNVAPIQSLDWNDDLNLITVVSRKHVQRFPYEFLCGTSFYAVCHESPWCKRFNNFCQARRKLISQPINKCVTPRSWSLSPNDQHISELFTCDQSARGCLLGGKLIGPGPVPDIICPELYCMCRVSVANNRCLSPSNNDRPQSICLRSQVLICADKGCPMYKTKRVDLVYCMPSKYSQTMGFVGEQRIYSPPSRVMAVTFFLSLALLFIGSALIFCCVGSPESKQVL
jgi:hypothetical protein